MNLTEIIENLPNKPIVKIKRLKEDNIYTLYYDKESKEYKTVIIDDSPIISNKSQLFDVQVELNRLKYAQIKQKIAETSRDVTNQLKLNSWMPESERLKIANNEELNVLNNAKVILYQWFSLNQVNPESLTSMPNILLPQNKYKTLSVPETGPVDNVQDDKVAFIKQESDQIIITYEGRKKYYRHDGFRYLFILFSNPKKKIHSTKLYNLIHAQSSDNLEEDMNHVQMDSSSDYFAIDEEAREQYENKLNELDKLMESADAVGNEVLFNKYQEESKQISDHLSKQIDIKGRLRKLNSEPEKHRTNIQRAIKRAFEKIELDFQDLYKLLIDSIITGNYCEYIPNTTLDITINCRT